MKIHKMGIRAMHCDVNFGMHIPQLSLQVKGYSSCPTRTLVPWNGRIPALGIC